MRVAVIGWDGQESNPGLVAAWRGQGIDAVLLTPDEAMWKVRPGDVALTRLDVLPTLDGVEAGLPVLEVLIRRGIRLLNGADAVLATHDKLETSRRLREAELPHPQTRHATSPRDEVDLPPPYVVKPRFGSWGRAVFRCANREALARCLHAVSRRPWFLKHGALVQEFIPSPAHDLRVIVAGGEVVGAARRTAAPGDWRTNVSLGGALLPGVADASASALAIAAASALGMDLVGVDLLPLTDGSNVVLELNAAVDFDERYSLPGRNVCRDAGVALGIRSALPVTPGIAKSTGG